jgi:hypothetical protein
VSSATNGRRVSRSAALKVEPAAAVEAASRKAKDVSVPASRGAPSKADRSEAARATRPRKAVAGATGAMKAG